MSGLTDKCATMDKPVAALLEDLRDRGLLDETLIVWGGEFGRTPFQRRPHRQVRSAGSGPLPGCLHDVDGWWWGEVGI
jgi:arylsulfatase A-like enzyme